MGDCDGPLLGLRRIKAFPSVDLAQPGARVAHRHRLQRFVVAFDNRHTVAIESKLRQLRAPTLIVWGTDDVYFPIKWAQWLARTIPSAKEPVVLEGARLFFPEERPETLNKLLRAHFAG